MGGRVEQFPFVILDKDPTSHCLFYWGYFQHPLLVWAGLLMLMTFVHEVSRTVHYWHCIST